MLTSIKNRARFIFSLFQSVGSHGGAGAGTNQRLSSFNRRQLPPQAQRRLRRGVRARRWWQVRLLSGGGLPVSGLLHPNPHRRFHLSHPPLSSLLPHPFPLPLPVPLQKSLLASTGSLSNNDISSRRGLAYGSLFSACPTKCVGGYSLNCAVSPLRGTRCCIYLFFSRDYSSISTLKKLNFGEWPICTRRRFCDYNYQGDGTSDDSDVEQREDALPQDKGFGEDEKENDGGDRAPSSAVPEEVDKVCRVVNELFAFDRNMEAVLDECGINLTHDLVVDVLERFKHARRPAFRFFSWAERRPGFSHDSRTYNTMIRILGRTRQFETMVSMLEEMGARELLTIQTFTIAIRAFAASRERKKAVGAFELMKKYKFKASVETFNCLLDSLGREKLVKEAQFLFEKLKSRFSPNLQSYSVLLNGWCKVKNLMEAGRVWNEMVDQGFKPDIVAHNIMLDCLLKVKRGSDAVKLFEIMKAKGPFPNVLSYTILVRYLCKHGKMVDSVAYFSEMLSLGCKPDSAIYTCLITGFGNQKKMDEVYGLLSEMKEQGCPPDGRTYNALIKLLTNQKMPEDAVRVYKKMIRGGIKPTIHTYNMMMRSCFAVGKFELGREVWDEMIRKGCCPDDNSYTVLIGGLVREGRSEEACNFLEEVINKGMRVPQFDCNKFVSNFSKAGRANILDELAEKMKDSGKFEASEVLARWAMAMRKNREGGRFY